MMIDLVKMYGFIILLLAFKCLVIRAFEKEE
jgi:hypothetical protein